MVGVARIWIRLIHEDSKSVAATALAMLSTHCFCFAIVLLMIILFKKKSKNKHERMKEQQNQHLAWILMLHFRHVLQKSTCQTNLRFGHETSVYLSYVAHHECPFDQDHPATRTAQEVRGTWSSPCYRFLSWVRVREKDRKWTSHCFADWSGVVVALGLVHYESFDWFAWR